MTAVFQVLSWITLLGVVIICGKVSGTECDLCFLSNPLSWNMAQTLAEKYGCNLASIETEEERAKMAAELSTHSLDSNRYWAGGTSSPNMTCSEPGDDDVQAGCSNPLSGSIEVVLEVTTGTANSADSTHIPIISFVPANSTAVPLQRFFPSALPDPGTSKRYTFLLNEDFACGFERFNIFTNDDGFGFQDGWLIADMVVEFAGQLIPWNLTVDGVFGLWLDGRPFDSSSFYAPFAFSSNWTFNCGATECRPPPAQWFWVDGTPFSNDFWAPSEPGPLDFLAVGIDSATNNNSAVFYDEVSSTRLPSVWECCGGCPQDLC